MQEHKPVDFSRLVEAVKGLSEKQITQHITLYQGYVKKLNEIEQKLLEADRSKANYSFGEYSELMRRRTVPFNGTFLHEAYFENLEPAGEADPDIVRKIKEEFGSLEKWQEDIKAAAISTPGWVLLTLDRTDGRLKHWVLFEHNVNIAVHQDILLALDCWEHAFMIDFGIDKASYLKVFMENINWDAVNKRLNDILKNAKM